MLKNKVKNMMDLPGDELLEHKDELMFIKKAKDGDEYAREIVLKNKVRFVIDIARKFEGHAELDDLVQVGMIGLNEAIDLFDEGYEGKFSTYAYFRILNQIDQEVSNKSRMIRLPAYINTEAKRVRDLLRKKEGENIEMSVSEIAKELEITERVVETILERDRGNLSLEWENSEGEEFGKSLVQGNFEEPSEAYIKKDLQQRLRSDLKDAINTLNSSHRDVLILRYGLDANGEQRTLNEIGEILNLSKERVRQLEYTALKTLRESPGRGSRRKKIRKYI